MAAPSQERQADAELERGEEEQEEHEEKDDGAGTIRYFSHHLVLTILYIHRFTSSAFLSSR